MTRKRRQPEPDPSQSEIDDIISNMGLPAPSAPQPVAGEAPSAEDPSSEDEPTLGDLMGDVNIYDEVARSDRAALIEVSDEPFPIPDQMQPAGRTVPSIRPPPLALSVSRQDESFVPIPTPMASADVRYVQRINVLEAWQYPGSLALAPPWIDRNWIAYVPYDDVTNEPAGPALNIPNVGLARRADFVVQQSVMLNAEGMSDIRLAIYRPEDFYKWFLPLNQGAAN